MDSIFTVVLLRTVVANKKSIGNKRGFTRGDLIEEVRTVFEKLNDSTLHIPVLINH